MRSTDNILKSGEEEAPKIMAKPDLASFSTPIKLPEYFNYKKAEPWCGWDAYITYKEGKTLDSKATAYSGSFFATATTPSSTRTANEISVKKLDESPVRCERTADLMNNALEAPSVIAPSGMSRKEVIELIMATHEYSKDAPISNFRA